MSTPQTCGEGLAEHATLPGKVAELFKTMAENLDLHQTTLDASDPAARREHEAYGELARHYREAVAHLEAAASRMARARDLPMGKHNPDALANPALAEVFERFVRLEGELADLLDRDLERDRQMLAGMHGARRRRWWP
jgi:hypothetical protein